METASHTKEPVRSPLAFAHTGDDAMTRQARAAEFAASFLERIATAVEALTHSSAMLVTELQQIHILLDDRVRHPAQRK